MSDVRGRLLLLLGLLLPSLVAAQPVLYGDLRARGDFVDDLPGGREIDRARVFGFLGYTGGGDTWEWGAALQFALGSDDNDDNVRNLDNEESDDLDLGELWARRQIGEHGRLLLGQAPMPLWLTPMTWDLDLRPAGVSYQHEQPVRDYDTLSLLAGYWSPHHIDEYDARLLGLQASWRIREGAPHSGILTLSYLDYSDLDELVSDRRTRTNRVANGRLVSDYELVNLTLQYRFPLFSRSAMASVDLVKNLGANDEDEAVRFSLFAGNAWNQAEWEVGYAYHRIQRDAVLAAFNSDDWWFPTRMRGWSPWVAYGIRDDLRVRLAGFVERRDDLDDHVKRVLLDLTWVF